jgi:hypothetical protein
MRIRDPKTTALIFASGKMVVTGAKSEDDSRLASRKYARIVQKLGFDAKFAEFKIQNIVGSCDVKFPIRLEGLAYSHGQFSSYEPEVRCPSVRVSFTHIYLAVPRTHLSHAQTQSCAPDFRIGKDSVDWCKGTDIHYILSRR